MESSSYEPVQQDQVHTLDWFQYASDPESEVEFIARNPTVKPYSVTKSMISENTPAETPNGGWRKTSWPNFDPVLATSFGPSVTFPITLLLGTWGALPYSATL